MKKERDLIVDLALRRISEHKFLSLYPVNVVNECFSSRPVSRPRRIYIAQALAKHSHDHIDPQLIKDVPERCSQCTVSELATSGHAREPAEPACGNQVTLETETSQRRPCKATNRS